MNSYLIIRYFIVANKTSALSPQNGMQTYKRYTDPNLDKNSVWLLDAAHINGNYWKLYFDIKHFKMGLNKR